MSARRFLVRLVTAFCVMVGVSMVIGVSAFASAPEAPSVVTVEAIKAKSVVVEGVLNPGAEGEAGTYEFVYKASATECQGAGTVRGLAMGLMGEEVSQEIEGLSANTEYAVCLLARTLTGETSVGPVAKFKTVLPPEVPLTEKATSVTARTAILRGVLNPANAGETGTYQFDYASAGECHYEKYEPKERTTFPQTATGLKREAVESEVTGLLPNTTYAVCVLAGNSAGETALGGPVAFTTLASAPLLDEESTQGAGTTEATLAARMEPGGVSTSYRVEYGPSIPYASSTPTENVTSNEPINIHVNIPNLQPGASYHYRFVLSNSLGTVQGADQTFGTYPTAPLGLPDDRGYEKVSPNNNADGNVYAAWPAPFATAGGWSELPYQASTDGNAVAYVGMPSEEGGSGREGGGGGNEYLARRRTGGGWQAENITPPSDVFATVPVYQGFSADLSHGFLTTNSNIPLVPGAPAGGYRIPYVRDFETRAYEALLSGLPPNRGKYEFGGYEVAKLGASTREPAFAGSSADLSHVLYMANDALTANAVDEGVEDNNLYDSHDGALTLVNVLPNGSPEPSAVYGGPVMGPDEPSINGPDFSHVISEDGNRIFWTGQGANRNIYMREDDSRTVQIDASEGGGSQYWTATPDGSKVLFTKAGGLYEYEVESGRTSDLAPSVEVQGIVGTSEDLSYIYFVANAALAPGGKQGSCEGSECGLYVLHVGEPIRYIATLSSQDNQREALTAYGTVGDWQGGLGDKESEVTPDGRDVLFSSVRSLTGYENKGAEELFVYEFEGANLHCISCNPSGQVPTGYFSAFLPVSHQNIYSRRWMSDDGSRVFFDSVDPLVPQDTNGLTDVYEWERDGAGDCTSSEGCVYLLTGGTGGEGAYLIDASASGNDVFFTTRAPLVAEDQNENIDVYDAHVGAIVPLAVPQCTGTGCQGLPSAPPVFSTPSSVTYNGVGNFAPAPKVAPTVKKTKAKAKKKRSDKKGKKRKRVKKRKAKKSASRRGDNGHESSAHRSAGSYGRSK